MRELDDFLLVERANVFGSIGGGRSSTDDVGKARPVGGTVYAAGAPTEQGGELSEPSKQTGLENATEGSEAFIKEVHLVLHYQARKGIVHQFAAVRP
jgi:hypothetical protein